MIPTARGDSAPPATAAGAERRPAAAAASGGRGSFARGPATLEALRQALETGTPAADGRAATPDRVLPVLPAIASVLPDGGLRRGSTVVLTGSTSLLLATLCVPSRAGAWCAVVGRPTLGLAAAAEYGIAMDRLALVPEPGHRWQTVTAALLDALDVVVVRPTGRFGGRFSGMDARRLSSRARERGAVLISLGDWEAADVRLWVTETGWSGLGQGHGRLRSQRIVVHTRGRGVASRPRRTTLVLRASPGRFGAVDAVGALPGGALSGPTGPTTVNATVNAAVDGFPVGGPTSAVGGGGERAGESAGAPAGGSTGALAVLGRARTDGAA
jgi:hypothetical protein